MIADRRGCPPAGSVRQQVREQGREGGPPATQRVAAPGEDRLQVGDRLPEVIVDDHEIELGVVGHVVHGIGEPPRDHGVRRVVRTGAAPAVEPPERARDAAVRPPRRMTPCCAACTSGEARTAVRSGVRTQGGILVLPSVTAGAEQASVER